MKLAHDLSHEELVRLVDQVQQILFLSANARGMIWDPDKEWDCETIEFVAGAWSDAGLKPEGVMERRPVGEPNRLADLVEQLVALDEANHDVQLAVDDLVYDEIGTGKHASTINNGGIANQAEALVERIGLEDTFQALQAVRDRFTQPGVVIVAEPPADQARGDENADPDAGGQSLRGPTTPQVALPPMPYQLNIDFAQLRDQKSALLDVIANRKDHLLMGLVHLMDAIQDQAVDLHGKPEVEVFGRLVNQ